MNLACPSLTISKLTNKLIGTKFVQIKIQDPNVLIKLKNKFVESTTTPYESTLLVSNNYR